MENNMEEKKNNQVQAMEDEALENVSGGWCLVLKHSPTGKLGESFKLSNVEVAKLKKAGYDPKMRNSTSVY